MIDNVVRRWGKWGNAAKVWARANMSLRYGVRRHSDCVLVFPPICSYPLVQAGFRILYTALVSADKTHDMIASVCVETLRLLP